MKKTVVFVIVTCFMAIISCNNCHKTNDKLLLSCLNDPTMDCFDKGKVFLDQDTLSEKVIRELLARSKDFEPIVIELILTSQYSLTNSSLIEIIKCDQIDKGAIENIILSKTPISKEVENYLLQIHGVAIDHKYDYYQKIVSICSEGVIYAEKTTSVFDCNAEGYIIENMFIRPFYNSYDCLDSKIKKMINSHGGGWIRGELVIIEKNGITHVFCKRPPYTKCAKMVSAEKELAISEKDALLINSINNKLNKYKLGNLLLNEEQLSEVVIDELNKNVCKIDSFVYEVLLISQDSLTDKILSSLILNPNVENKTLTNVLISKAPLSNYIHSLLRSFRPELLQSEIEKYNESEILISLCNQSLIIGDSINVVIKDKIKTFSVYNQNIIPLNSSISNDDKLLFITGGNNPRWVYGELSAHTNSDNISHYICVRPPENKKCMKLAKIKK